MRASLIRGEQLLMVGTVEGWDERQPEEGLQRGQRQQSDPIADDLLQRLHNLADSIQSVLNLLIWHGYDAFYAGDSISTANRA